MKYKVSYYFGEREKDYLCNDYYELESIINFMFEKWMLKPQTVLPIIGDKK